MQPPTPQDFFRENSNTEFRAFPPIPAEVNSKKKLREIMVRNRSEIPYSEQIVAAAAVREFVRAWPPFRDAHCVCSYISLRSEMPTPGIILRVLESGKSVIVPKVFGETLRFFRIKNLTDDLERGGFGVLEPRENCEEVSADQADICLIPGLAFDQHGNRIGYGKGFYDRFLATLPNSIPTLGLAFDQQVFDAIPFTMNCDVPVKFLVTPSRGIFATK